MALEGICDKGCQLCPLYATAKTVCVEGSGAGLNAALICIGEAPGPREDAQGEPFVGPSGNELREILAAAGVPQPLVRFENIVRCIPKKEDGTVRPPHKKESKECVQYLYRVLDEFWKARQGDLPILVALGNTALELLTGNGSITKNRGIEFPLVVHPDYTEQYAHLADFRVIGTIHPASVVRGSVHNRPRIQDDLTIAFMLATKNVPNYAEGYRVLDTVDEVEDYFVDVISRYREGQCRAFAFDFETARITPEEEVESLDMFDPHGRILCFTACCEKGKAVLVPWDHKDSPWRHDEFAKERIVNVLRKAFAKVPVYGWNFKFDYKWLVQKLGITDVTVLCDGQLARYWILGKRAKGEHSLKNVSAEELSFYGHGRAMHAALQSLPKNLRHMGNVSPDVLLEYAGADADATYQLCDIYLDKLQRFGMLEGYTKFMMDGLIPIAELEMNGLAVDPNTTRYLLDKYPRDLEPLEIAVRNSPKGADTARILESKGLSFSLGSTATLRELLFEQYGLPTIYGSSETTGEPSTAKKVLDKLLEHTKAKGNTEAATTIETILKWRKLVKDYSTYIKKMPLHTRSDGYFHTTYNMDGTATGRASSSSPSLHTIAKGSKIRWQFVSRWKKRGGLIIQADASQMELRVVASLSGDENLIEALTSGEDVHTANAMKIFGVPKEKVTKELRQLGKVVSFSSVYGAQAPKIAETTGLSIPESQKLLDSLFKAYKKLKPWMDGQYQFAKEHGFVMTPFGRIRWIPFINESRPGDKAHRLTGNTAVQSVASDITYLALLGVVKDLHEKGCQSKPFGFIHDSIIVDTHPEEWWTVLETLHKNLVVESAKHSFLKVPIVAEYELCPGWGFPCVASWDGDMITAKGPEMNVNLLVKELDARTGYHIVEDKIYEGKGGGTDRSITFSLSPLSGTPDFEHTDKKLILF